MSELNISQFNNLFSSYRERREKERKDTELYSYCNFNLKKDATINSFLLLEDN